MSGAPRFAFPGRRALWLPLCLFAASCATVGPNFHTPAALTAKGYLMEGDTPAAGAVLDPATRVAGPWWRALGSPELNAVMDEALAGNRTVAAADATLAHARAQAEQVDALRYPAIDLQTSTARERINLKQFGFAGAPNPVINLFSIGGTVSYDLDLFGANRRRLESARASEAAQAHRADAAYLTLTGDVALRAVEIADLRARLAAIQAIIADDTRNLEIVHAALKVGGEPKSSGAGVRAQLAADQALAPPVEQALAQTRHALAELVGRAPAEWKAPDFDLAGFSPPHTIPAAVPSDLVRRRPDIRAAEDDLHAATAQIGVATANLYPDIRLSAGWAQGALAPEDLFSYSTSGWNIGSGLVAPIFHGGALKAARRAAEADARSSLAIYQRTVLDAFTQVADALTALAHDDEDLAALRAAESAAEDSLADTRAAYALGGVAYLPLVHAQIQVNHARLNRVQAEARRLADIVRLYAATAADWGHPPATPG